MELQTHNQKLAAGLAQQAREAGFEGTNKEVLEAYQDHLAGPQLAFVKLALRGGYQELTEDFWSAGSEEG